MILILINEPIRLDILDLVIVKFKLLEVLVVNHGVRPILVLVESSC